MVMRDVGTTETNQLKRRREYEKVREQLDLLYHDMTAGKLDTTGEWYKSVKAVKDKYTK